MKEVVARMLWDENDPAARRFDLTMAALIVVSIVAMTMETLPGLHDDHAAALGWLNFAILAMFTVEYGLRLWTAPKRLSYVRSFWGIVDLASFLPYWLAIGSGSQSMRILRLLRLLKLMRYVPAIERMRRAALLVWRELAIVLMMAVMMMFITGVGIYNFESEAQPEQFGSIPQSLWFAVTTLTTVGYGDAVPVTPGGKFFTFLILMVGLGIVALPAAVVGAAMQQARDEERMAKAEKGRRLAEKRAAEAGTDRFTPGDGVCGE